MLTSTTVGFRTETGEWAECECVKHGHKHEIVRSCPQCTIVLPADTDHFYRSAGGRWGSCLSCHAKWNRGRRRQRRLAAKIAA